MHPRLPQILWIGFISLSAFLFAAFQDFDRDGLDDAWEAQYGFSTNAYSATNLVGWWQLNQTNGLQAPDRSTNNLPLTLTKGAGWATNGLFNQAIQLDGKGYLQATSSAAYNLTNFTFSAWVKGTNGPEARALARWIDTQTNGWQFGTAADGRPSARFSTAVTGKQIFQALSASNIIDNQWHHLALTYSSSNSLARIYLDGTLEAEKTIQGQFNDPVDTFRIGKGWDKNWMGCLDEIRLYSRALRADEIPLLPNTYADPDGDGLSNLQEFQRGSDPLNPDTDGDGRLDGADPLPLDFYDGRAPVINITGGNFQSGPPNTWLPQPLAVQVTDSNGQPLANAPLTFTVAQGGGLIAASMQDAPVASLASRTAANGQASVIFLLPPLEGQTSLIRVAAQSGSSVVQTTFSASSYATVESPVFNPDGGSFDDWVDVSITTATPGASIRYTTDGSDPTPYSTLYMGPFTLTESVVLKAKALKEGWDSSLIKSADYRIQAAPFIPSIRAVAADINHSLAVDEKGRVWSWGADWSGIFPNPVAGLSGIVAVAAGASHALALRSDGTVWSWGETSSSNRLGQLGRDTGPTSSVQPRFPPGLVEGLNDVQAISAAGDASLALKTDGTVWTWGLGIRSPIQVPGLFQIKAISAGLRSHLALTEDGRVFVWYGSSSPFWTGLENMTAVAAGEFHSFALKSDGTVWAWGFNSNGQLGNGTVDPYYQLTPRPPARVFGLGNVAAIASGYAHGVALKTDGSVWAWGANTFGQLGDGSFNDQYLPVQVHGPNNVGFLTKIKAIAAGPNYTFAIQQDGTLWAWGLNNSGQLGDSTILNRNIPVEVFKVASPSYDPSGGLYHEPQNVAIQSSTAGAVVHYTLDGSEPTDDDPILSPSSTVLVERNKTLKARAWKNSLAPSNTSSADYTTKVATPTLTPGGGFYQNNQSVKINCATPAATLHYTTDGREPDESDAALSPGSTLVIGHNITLKVKAWYGDFEPSSIVSATYQIGTSDDDGDGIPYSWEIKYGLDPTRNDANEDTDGDGLSNLDEFRNHTDPGNPDTDGDETNDGTEVANGTEPAPDSDGDGLLDRFEIEIGTDPNKVDSDDNGVPDAVQLFYVAQWGLLANDPSGYGIAGEWGSPDNLAGRFEFDIEPGRYCILAAGFPVRWTWPPTLEPNPQSPATDFAYGQALANNQLVYDGPPPEGHLANYYRVFASTSGFRGGVGLTDFIDANGHLILEFRDPTYPSSRNPLYPGFGSDWPLFFVQYHAPDVQLSLDSNVVGVGSTIRAYVGFPNTRLLTSVPFGRWSLNFDSSKIKVFWNDRELVSGVYYPRGTAWSIQLTIQGLLPSDSLNDVSLKASFILDKKIEDKAQYLTVAEAQIAVDANRDGEIHMDNDSDKTTLEKPFRFWCNEDRDNSLEQEQESSTPDHQDGVITSKRDLEDFARIWMQVTPPLDNVTVKLTWNGDGAINIYGTNEPGGGTKYLTDETTAANIVNVLGVATRLARLAKEEEAYTFNANYFSDGQVKHFIFEGAGVGKGELILLVKKGEQVVTKSSVHLDLKDIKDMYERASLDDGKLEPLPLVDPTDPKNNIVPTDPDEAKQLIVFIHGWNNTQPEWLMTSETLFKRLWWQGYKGRVATLRWPCDQELELFNRSEFQAFKSGLGASRYFNRLKSRFPDYSLNIFAHSQGAVVAGEALNEQVEGRFRAVSNVVLTQGAIPVHCYNGSAAAYDQFILKEAEPGHQTPDAYRNRFGTTASTLGVKITSFYNAFDFALVTGTIGPYQGIEANWERNQVLLKPDWYRGYFIAADGTAYWSSGGEYPTIREVTDSRELMAMAARSRSKAVGAIDATGGSIAECVNIGKGTASDFTDTRPDHSGQFARGIQVLGSYYRELLKQFQINANP